MKKNTIPTKVIRNVIYAVRLVWTYDRLLFFLRALPQLIDGINALVIVVLPKLLLDSLIDGRFEHAIGVVIAFACWELLASIIKAAIMRSTAVRDTQFQEHLGQKLFNKMIQLRHEQFESPELHEKYEFANKCVSEGDMLSFITSSMAIVGSIITISGIGYILSDLPWWILTILALVVIVNTLVNIASKNYYVEQMEEETPTERRLYYTRGRLRRIEYAKEIRAFDLSSFISEKYCQYVEGLFNIFGKYDKKSTNALRWTIIAAKAQMFVFYAYNIVHFARKLWTVGTFSMNMSAMLQLSSSANSIASEVVSMGRQNVLVDRFLSFLETPSTYTGRLNTQYEDDFVIEFDNVSFRYPGQESYALKDVTIKINAGEKLSIVGLNGAGKTTFVSLLLGLYKPQKGRILLNGQDIEDIDYKAYSKLFSAVMQDYQVYAFTIRDNITFASEPTAVETQKALDALDKIGLGKVVNGLPERENTYITERFNESGIRLSGGEDQRLAIARTLYQNAPIMILDEPTSALSPQSEYDIYNRFSEITQDKTVLYISHRLSSCSLCDRILVFDEGELIENGSHDELIKSKRLYAEMYSKQYELYGGTLNG